MKTRTFISAIALACSVMASAQVVIDIDATQRGPKISPTHYGIFYEDGDRKSVPPTMVSSTKTSTTPPTADFMQNSSATAHSRTT